MKSHSPTSDHALKAAHSLARRTKFTVLAVLMLLIGALGLARAVSSTDAAAEDERYPPSEAWLEAHEDDNDSDTVAIRCPSRGRCIAPGTCTRSELDPMQSKKDSLCNQKRSCAGFKIKPPADPAKVQSSELVDCGELTRLIAVGEACRDQRTKIMHDCFRDGDQAHVDERSEVQDVIDDCADRLSSAKGMKICKW